MDKEIIYIDPSDDITDIISKIKEAKNKAVALVPPKKSSVLQSSVNFKLIAKTAKNNEKDISLITTSDSLKHLAANAKIPVASNPKSTAVIPDLEEDFHKPAPSKIIEADDDISEDDENSVDEEEKSPSKTKTEKPEKKSEPKDLNSSRKSKEEKKASKPKKDSIVPNIAKYRKWIILGAIVLLGLIAFLIWALAFAPGVTVSAKVQTSSHNLTKNLEFVTTNTEANVKGGVLLAKEETHTESSEVEFNATGEKDNGKKAEYEISVVRDKTGSIKSGQSVKALSISEGSTLTYNGLNFKVTSGVTFPSFEANASNCDQMDTSSDGSKYFDECHTSSSKGKVTVAAAEPGEKYNGASSTSGWSHNGYSITSVSQKTSGTSEKVKIVTDQDIRNAEANANFENDSDKIRNELADKFDRNYYVIASSFNGSDKKSTSSIPAGQQVNGDTKPKLKVEMTYRMIAVSRKDLNEYIKEQVNQDGLMDKKTQEVFKTGVNEKSSTNKEDDAYFESFEKVSDGKYTARLKTVVEIGPKIEEDSIKEKIVGKKIGEAQAELQNIEGLRDIRVKSNFFWVNSVPNDPNRVKLEIENEEE